jgi:hypothetical protein
VRGGLEAFDVGCGQSSRADTMILSSETPPFVSGCAARVAVTFPSRSCTEGVGGKSQCRQTAGQAGASSGESPFEGGDRTHLERSVTAVGTSLGSWQRCRAYAEHRFLTPVLCMVLSPSAAT